MSLEIRRRMEGYLSGSDRVCLMVTDRQIFRRGVDRFGWRNRIGTAAPLGMTRISRWQGTATLSWGDMLRRLESLTSMNSASSSTSPRPSESASTWILTGLMLFFRPLVLRFCGVLPFPTAERCTSGPERQSRNISRLLCVSSNGIARITAPHVNEDVRCTDRSTYLHNHSRMRHIL